jgi:hypothetical protein
MEGGGGEKGNEYGELSPKPQSCASWNSEVYRKHTHHLDAYRLLCARSAHFRLEDVSLGQRTGCNDVNLHGYNIRGGGFIGKGLLVIGFKCHASEDVIIALALLLL